MDVLCFWHVKSIARSSDWLELIFVGKASPPSIQCADRLAVAIYTRLLNNETGCWLNNAHFSYLSM